MNFKKAFFIVLIILIATNLFWLYESIDQSVTHDYTMQGYKYLKEDINLMRELMTDFSEHESKDRMVKIVKDKYSGHIVKEEEGILFIDRIGLKFEGNKLAKIAFMNEP